MMKKSILSVILILMCFASQAQTILLEQNFSTASGVTPPIGWTIQTATGDPVIDVWHFDNPGRREPNSPIVSNFAIFDSDKYSDNGMEEVVYLVSPVFNGTTDDNIKIVTSPVLTEQFSEQTSVLLSPIVSGSSEWGDYDNDGDLDILLTGNNIFKIYRNNGDNTFTEQTGISLTGVNWIT